MYASTDVLAKIEFVYKTIHSHKVRTDVLTYYHPQLRSPPPSQANTRFSQLVVLYSQRTDVLNSNLVYIT